MPSRTPLHLAAATVVLLLSACASRPETEVTVDTWVQFPHEHGQLAVGRVVAVEPYRIDVIQPQTDHRRYAALTGVIGLAPTLAITYLSRPPRHADTGYRHAVRLRAANSLILFEHELAYPVGECVAFRPGLSSGDVAGAWPVKALPGECGDDSVGALAK
jgi:hypothetical protein